MKKEIGGFVARLSSRKFLLVVAGITLVTMYPDQAAAITTLIGIFVGGEGAADVVSRYATEQTRRSSVSSQQDSFALPGEDPNDVDTSVIVAGDAPM